MADTNNRSELENKIIERAMKDSDFKAALSSDPRGTIEKEMGIKLPSDLKISIAEEKPNELYVVIPFSASNSAELSDEELGQVAGGWSDPTCVNRATAC